MNWTKGCGQPSGTSTPVLSPSQIACTRCSSVAPTINVSSTNDVALCRNVANPVYLGSAARSIPLKRMRLPYPAVFEPRRQNRQGNTHGEGNQRNGEQRGR